MTTEEPKDALSEVRKELEAWLTRNMEIEQIMASKGANLSPMTFLSARLNHLIDTLIGPIDDHDEESPRMLWEVEIAKATNNFLTTMNQQIDAELRKAKLVQGVGQTAQQLHLPH